VLDLSQKFLRHDLLWLRGDVYRQLSVTCNPSLSVPPVQYGDEQLFELLQGEQGWIPAIVRRCIQGIDPPELIPVGFVLPEKQAGHRVRIAANIGIASVERRMTPFELPAILNSHLCSTASLSPALRAASAISDLAPLDTWGLWGSIALTLATGIVFEDQSSDLDILVRNLGNRAKAGWILREVDLIAARFSLRIDVEAYCQDGSGVSLRELVSGAPQVLIKCGSGDVDLIDNGAAWLLCGVEA